MNEEEFAEQQRQDLAELLEVLDSLCERLAARQQDPGRRRSPDEVIALAGRLDGVEETRTKAQARLAEIEKRLDKLRKKGGGRQFPPEVSRLLEKLEAQRQYREGRIDALFEDVNRLRARWTDEEYLHRYFEGRKSMILEYEVWTF